MSPITPQKRADCRGSCAGCAPRVPNRLRWRWRCLMLGLMFPLPERYSAQLSPLEDHCVTFISPRWTLQRPPRSEDTRSLRLESGMMKYCSVAALQDEVGRMKAPPDRQLVRGSLSISIWSSDEKPGARTTVYASNGRDALWISDPNPYLWGAMMDAATSAAFHSQ
jgi:hypothetical protein